LACEEKTKNTNGAFVFGEKKAGSPPEIGTGPKYPFRFTSEIDDWFGQYIYYFNFVEARFGLPIQLK